MSEVQDAIQKMPTRDMYRELQVDILDKAHKKDLEIAMVEFGENKKSLSQVVSR